ncbi:Golgin subfamily A member 2, partial [Eumeta japonica]
EKWKQLKIDKDKLQNELKEACTKVQELTDKLYQSESLNNNLDLSKLNADITSDKVAAQRAITQNHQLKKEIEDLQEVYVKMSKDKLELVEKLDAEKFLNRELTIKLAEIEDKSNDLMPKLMAKDSEMIRLQAQCSKFEKELEDKKQQVNELIQEINLYKTELVKAQEANVILNAKFTKLEKAEPANDDEIVQNTQSEHNVMKCEHRFLASDHGQNELTMLSIEDAMLKLQERFLNKMKEVADLSDEKQKLEHIVMQLQNETDTICEYVALYQQQRGILRRREEERNAQIKFFESERERMRTQLEGLANIITKLSEDNKLQTLLQEESKREDVFKIHRLIANIKNNHFMNPNKQYIDLEAFHPCAWCSGKLIDV